jgi:hypothetical protein
MFQSGYLTVKEIIPSDAKIYKMGFPNLEVKLAIGKIKLQLESNFKFKNHIAVLNQAKAMLNAILNLEKEKFESAFESFIGNFPYNQFVASEAYYVSLFHFAMILVGREIYYEEQTSDGRLDVRMPDRDRGVFIFEFKYLDLKSVSPKKEFTTDDIPFIRKKMEDLSVTILNQIDFKKYTSKFKGGSGKIYKIPVITARHSDVFVMFVEETNKTT